MAHPLWPLFDLRLRTARLELRLPTDDDIVALYRAAKDGIHDPDWQPFTVPWTDAPSPEFERGFVLHYWRKRADWTVARWDLPFAVICDGVHVGVQEVHGHDFPRLHEVGTGSWLGQRFQGQGIGKEMRAAVLHFAFTGLGAQWARSQARADNAGSIGVSRALGYEDDGLEVAPRRDEVVFEQRLRLSRERWARFQTVDVEIEGLDTCRDLFGA